MIIPSVRWVKEYKNQLIRLEHLHKNFIETKARELANKMIVDPIRDEMERMGVHRKIWESVIVKDVVYDTRAKVLLIRIHSEYFAENGFDVAVAREYGTKDHFIQPLSSASQFTSVDPNLIKNLPKTLSWIQDGKRRFSKGHMVSGLPRLNIIRQTIEKTEFDIHEKLWEEYKKWLNDLFS